MARMYSDRPRVLSTLIASYYDWLAMQYAMNGSRMNDAASMLSSLMSSFYSMQFWHISFALSLSSTIHMEYIHITLRSMPSPLNNAHHLIHQCMNLHDITFNLPYRCISMTIVFRATLPSTTHGFSRMWHTRLHTHSSSYNVLRLHTTRSVTMHTNRCATILSSITRIHTHHTMHQFIYRICM